jgi:uncharacterized LabA/DUF88 family protein
MKNTDTSSPRTPSPRRPRARNDDMVSRLAALIEHQRVGIFIDAANLYFGSTSKGIHISYPSIVDWFTTHSRQCFLNFYTAYKPEDTKQIEFIAEMERIGYHVIKKPVKIFADNNMKGNLDIELAVDSVEQRDQFDVYILISGDGDFQYVFQTLKGYGKKTMLIGVGGYTSFELHAEADHYFFIDRIRAVWQEKKRLKSQSQYYIFADQLSQIDHQQPLEMIVPPKELKAKNMTPGEKLETLKQKKIQATRPRIAIKTRKTPPKSPPIEVYL